jgi:hypothetical protein
MPPLEIGTLDPRILALLGLMTSSSAGTNLNVLQDVGSDASFGLPLSTVLGTLPFEYLQSIVEGSEFASAPVAGFKAPATFDLYSGDEVLAPLMEAVDMGADPDQLIAEEKARVTEADLTPVEKDAAKLRLDGYLSVLKMFQTDIEDDKELLKRIDDGDVVQRDGQFFERVPESERLSTLRTDYGITGPLADLSMYDPSQATQERRDAATAAAEKFLADREADFARRSYALGDEFSDGVSAAEKRMEIDRAVQQARDMAETQRRREALGDRQPPAPDAFQTFPQARNVLDPTTVAAMAGMYQSRKPTQMSQQEYDRRQAQINADVRNERTQAQSEYEKMLEDASKIGAGEKTAAERYLENQQRILTALSTPPPEQPKSSGVAARRQIRLPSGEIDRIIGSLVRR